ncbi:MAG: metal-dependent transcriptional regulator [Chloroflexota bacterium]
MTDDALSSTMRDYLVNIYNLSDRNTDDHYVSTSELADALHVSAPAVNRMVTKLRDMNLLEHERYQGIYLTKGGELEALKQLRRQRIAEAFLVNVMNFGWHEVHHEAEQMSSALSEMILERMSNMAGNPTHSPHGAPIPAADGTYTPPADTPLVEVEPERDYSLSRVMTREPDRLEYLAALGLMPGETFTLLHRAPFNGPMQLHLAREYRIIGYNLAEVIRVKPAGADKPE